VEVAQRQVAYWNRSAGRGRRGRGWRLDRIVAVGDGVLPLAGGSAETEPDRRDRSVALMYGFPARQVAPGGLFTTRGGQDGENPFFIHAGLVPDRRISLRD
jgi:hypothetical protein